MKERRERKRERETNESSERQEGRKREGEGGAPPWKDGDGNSNSLLPPVKYNSRAHSRLDNPRSLCMKTYYAAGSSVRTEPLSTLLFPPVAALSLSLSHSLSPLQRRA